MKTKTFSIGLVFGVLIAIMLATRSQDKKPPQIKQVAKKDSIITQATLPDSTVKLIKEVDSLKKTYDQVLSQGKEKLRTEERFVRELKGQNATLIKLTRNFPDVDPLPSPSLIKSEMAIPDSIPLVSEEPRRNFFNRLFRKK